MERDLLAHIITSHPSFDCDNPPTHQAFLHFWFDHPEFCGYGRELLERCGHDSGLLNFRTFIGAALPEAAAAWFLLERGASTFRTEPQDGDPVGHELLLDAGLSADGELDLETLIDARKTKAWTESAFRSLNQRSRHCLRLYWGLDGQEPMTLEAIADGYGIVRSRVQQIIEAAEERMQRFFRERATPTPPGPVPLEPEQYALLVAEHMWRLRPHRPRRLYRSWIEDFVQTWMRQHLEAQT